MQEIFEKIKERLEEKSIEHAINAQQFGEDGWTTHASKEYIISAAYGNAIEIVNQVAEEVVVAENATTNGGWIPCSERLPEEEYDTVLAVTDKKHYCVAVYTTEHGFRTMDIDCEGNFIAWQPLPEPYRGE